MVTRALAGLLCLGLLWPTFAAAQIGSVRVVDGVAAGQADVQATSPAGTEYGIVVRPIGTTDNTAFTADTTGATVIGGFYHATRDAITDGNAGAIAVNANRALLIQLENSSKVEMGTQTAPLGVRFSDGTNFIAPSAVDTDDGSIAGGQTNVSLSASFNYLFDGTNWASRHLQATNSLNSTGGGLAASQAVGQCDDAAVTALTENSFGNARINCTTHEILVTASPQSAAAWGVYIEDGAETGGGNLMMAGSVRRDVAVSSASQTGDNATLNTDGTGLLWTRNADPCSGLTKTAYVVNIASATTTEIANADASNKFYICSINVVASAAQAVAVVEDDTDTCGSPTLGLNGGVTAATGWSFAATGGIALGNGTGTVMKTSAVNRYLCLMTSTTGQLSGTIMYATAP